MPIEPPIYRLIVSELFFLQYLQIAPDQALPSIDFIYNVTNTRLLRLPSAARYIAR